MQINLGTPGAITHLPYPPSFTALGMMMRLTLLVPFKTMWCDSFEGNVNIVTEGLPHFQKPCLVGICFLCERTHSHWKMFVSLDIQTWVSFKGSHKKWYFYGQADRKKTGCFFTTSL